MSNPLLSLFALLSIFFCLFRVSKMLVVACKCILTTKCLAWIYVLVMDNNIMYKTSLFILLLPCDIPNFYVSSPDTLQDSMFELRNYVLSVKQAVLLRNRFFHLYPLN